MGVTFWVSVIELSADCSIVFRVRRESEANMRSKTTRKFYILSMHLFIPKFFKNLKHSGSRVQQIYI